MSPSLCGLHDRESASIAPPGTWALDTVALSDNPPPIDYPRSLNWITRLNWAYGSGGTLPLPSVYEAFAQVVAKYVNGSSGCSRWQIGNEPNLSREWPDHQPIYPWNYAACFKLCRQAIHALPGHAQDEVLIAASGPWNDELKYNSNPKGDWITYFTDVITLIGAACDGYAIHAYTHGYDVNLVTSSARMDRPFQNRFYEFYTYRDYCEAIPPDLRRLPVYLTEANGNGPWQAVRLMPAMLQEVDTWNHSKLPKIHCVVFYRYPRYDQFYIEGRGDVIAEYQNAVALGYESPMLPTTTPPTPQPPTPEPPQPQPPMPAPEPARDIDPRLIARGVEFDFVTPRKGVSYWRITKAQWLDHAASQVGPDHHILGRVLKDNVETPGVPLIVAWPSGFTTVTSKRDDPNATYNYDYGMSASLNEYSITVNDGNQSDKASGIGMGKDGNPREHTSTWINFEWTISEGVTAPPTPVPPGGELVHPLPGAVITQHWGENSAEYARFGMWGHNGTDLGNRPIRTPIRSMAGGIVAYSDFDVAYGHYVRLDYRDGDAYFVYCHLDEPGAPVGTRLEAGDTVGLLGSSGNSSAPHLHLEIRLQNKDGTYREDTPMSKGRVDPETWCVIHNLKL